MIGSVSGFSALSYLNQVKGVSPVAPVSKQPESKKSDAASPDAPLQSGEGFAISSDLLSLLQNADAGSDTGQQLSELLQSAQVTASDSAAGGLLTSDKNSPIGGLLGNGSVPSALGGLLGNSNSGTDPFLDTLLAQGGSAKPFEQAVSAAAQAKASTKAQSQDYLSNLGAFHAGFNAYNKVLQQNAAAAIKASQQAQASVEA